MLSNIFDSNVCQLQTSFTPVNIVHLALFNIPYKMNSSYNVPCVFGILTILIHTHSILTFQYIQRNFLWNYIWILVQSSAESEYNAECIAVMDLAYLRMLIHELLNKDPDIVP